MRLNCDVEARGDVTLVHLHLTNDADRARTARVTNNLEGPVLFPCRQGEPAPGWDADGWRGTLEPGAARALGYACRAEATDPPAAVTETGPPEAREATPGAVLAARGDPRPPRDAVPTPDGATGAPDGDPARRETGTVAPAGEGTTARTASADAGGGPTAEAVPDPVPAAVDDWLADVARRAAAGGTPRDRRAVRAVSERLERVRGRLES